MNPLDRSKFGWDLPPGVTNADIDKHFGDPPTKQCKECGDDFEPEDEDDTVCQTCKTTSPCCGVEFDEDIRICPECGEQL